MALPARGTAAAAQAYRNQKRWSSALALWDQALSQQPMNDDYLIGRIKTLADARHDGQALSEARRLAADHTQHRSPADALLRLFTSGKKLGPAAHRYARAGACAAKQRNALISLLESLSSNRISTPALQWSSQNHLNARAAAKAGNGTRRRSGYGWRTPLPAVNRSAFAWRKRRSTATTRCSPVGVRIRRPQRILPARVLTASVRYTPAAITPRSSKNISR